MTTSEQAISQRSFNGMSMNQRWFWQKSSLWSNKKDGSSKSFWRLFPIWFEKSRHHSTSVLWNLNSFKASMWGNYEMTVLMKQITTWVDFQRDSKKTVENQTLCETRHLNRPSHINPITEVESFKTQKTGLMSCGERTMESASSKTVL